MPGNPFYKEHWVDIEPAQLDRYQRMFQRNPASSALYEPADIRPGNIVAELGCGPGYTAVEIAKWVGADGHVHALDINADFVAQARKNADAAGVGDRVTAHRCDGSRLPLPEASLDRLTARNTLIYVDDPEATLRECRRLLRSAGGEISDAAIDRMLFSIEQARADGSYLFLAPQFVVTATR